MNEEELLKKLREAFKMESEERLENISASLLELEKATDDEQQKPIIEKVFREAHSLKGAARAVNMSDIEMLCQSIESVFSALKKDEFAVSSNLFDTLHDAVRTIEATLADSEEEPGSERQSEIAEIICMLDNMKLSDGIGNLLGAGVEEHPVLPEAEEIEPAEEMRETALTVQTPSVETYDEEPSLDKAVTKYHADMKKPLISETVRIAASRLDALLLEAEEIASLKLVSSQRLLNLKESVQSLELWKKRWFRVESDFRTLRNKFQKEYGGEWAQDGSPWSKMLEFLDWNFKHIHTLGRSIGKLTKDVEQDHRTLSRMVDEHLNGMKQVMMMPFAALFSIFPRMVRDICRDQGKEADLFLDGGEIEVDRRILEEMKDPMIHLLRNSVDHGLESPRQRRKLEKPARGAIRLSVSRIEGSKVEILITDDGKGIDVRRIRDEAVKSGLVNEKDAARLKDREIMQFVFRSGISSSPIITELSGRGLGLAIVQEKIEKLGGLISMETEAGRGTTFRIHLPVTLATFRGVLVRAAGDHFIVPGSHVDRVLKIKPGQVKTVENRKTVSINREVLSLVELAGVLGLSGPKEVESSNKLLTVMVLGSGAGKIAFKVSEVICEQEVLVKSLGKQLARIPYISGATILGTGEVVPILSVHDLLKAPGETAAVEIKTASETKRKDKRVRSVLVAEDSITSRMLLKNILEAAGYRVRTAVDGKAAFTALKTEKFDIVVSDAEMPRMNGFELTSNIRANDKTSNTPVILVTSLDSREDKERGIDAGANAYIVKSSFDQSNLLDVIERLI